MGRKHKVRIRTESSERTVCIPAHVWGPMTHVRRTARPSKVTARHPVTWFRPDRWRQGQYLHLPAAHATHNTMPLKYPSTITTSHTQHYCIIHTHAVFQTQTFARTALHRLAGTPPDVTAPTNRDPGLHNEGDVKPCESAAELHDTEHVEGWAEGGTVTLSESARTHDTGSIW